MFNVGPPQFAQRFKEAKRDWKKSAMRKDLGALKKVGVTATHTKPPTQWTIDEIVNMDATEAKFPDPDDRRPGITDKERKQISVAAYFKSKYGINCMPGIPVVRMTKKIRKGAVYMPMDVLRIDANQRYNTKLSDVQTSQMIKFAVTLPKDRWAAVQQGVRLLNWENDPYLNHYGLKISPK
jgi:eukaryotic translation initiation factor 2C